VLEEIVDKLLTKMANNYFEGKNYENRIEINGKELVIEGEVKNIKFEELG